MKLKIKPISSLLNYDFVIPNYQRGYRWDNEQVEALLNDLKDFVERADKGMFYCLQPVVVVKESKDKYIVVDGQQRLTTIYLIMHLREMKKMYTLNLPGRDKQHKFIKDELFADVDDKTYINNIDNFYLRKAYDTIREWQSKEENEEDFDHFKYIFSKSDSRYGYVAVIWYDLSEDNESLSPEMSRKSAMAAFRRLNFGKIPLNSAELVKALLLQTDLYSDSTIDVQRSIAQRRAMEWDDMEHRLANPLFASMVSKRDDENINGIGIILDVVAETINSKLFTPQKRKTFANGSEDLFAFHVIDRKIKEDTDGVKDPSDSNRWLSAPIERSQSIKAIWEEIQQTFNLLTDWFENREWFHLIGLLRQFSRLPSRAFISMIYKLSEKSSGADTPGVISKKRSKSEFRRALITAIGKDLKVNMAKENNVPLPPEQQDLDSPNLRYHEKEQSRMIQILTAFNVKMCMDNPDDTVRFPFHLFRQFNAVSLEHIHPQNITENLTYEQACDWLADRVADTKTADEEVWKRVAKSVGEYKGNDDTDKVAFDEGIEAAKEKINTAIERAGELMKNENSYIENKDEVFDNLRILDLLFGDMAGISQSELHSIWNMALVPQDINSALSNNYLDKKREILLEKKNTTYIPPATLKIFSKGFRPGNPGNMKFWQPEDRALYKAALQDTYDFFTTSNLSTDE